MTNMLDLTTGVDTFSGLAGDYNDFLFTPSTLQGTDTITGNATAGFLDVLVATEAGTITAAQFDQVTNIEELDLAAAGNTVALSNGLVAGSSRGYFLVVEAGGNNVVDASGITNGTEVVIQASSGDDTLGGGNGNDVFLMMPTNLTSSDTISGGAGFDYIEFIADGAVSASALANVSGIEALVFDGKGNSVTLTDALVNSSDTGQFTIRALGNAANSFDGSGLTSTRTLIFYAGAGADTLKGAHGNDAFVFTNPGDLTSADTVSGGTGDDAILFVNGGNIAASAFANVTGIEEMALSFQGNNVTLSNSLVAGSSVGAFAVAAQGGVNLVDAGNVTNNVSISFIGGNNSHDTFFGGSGSDEFVFKAANLTSDDFVAGGSGTDALDIVTGGTVAASAFTNVFGIEILNLRGGDINVTLNNTIGSTNSVGGLFVVDNGANNTVDASAFVSSTLSVIAGAGNDTFIGGNVNDVFSFAAADLTSADTVIGGAGSDTLVIRDHGTVAAADNAGVSQIEAVQLSAGGEFDFSNTLSTTTVFASGSAAVDTLDGSAVTNYALQFFGNGGADTLIGGAKNDSFNLADNAFAHIDGGAGLNSIVLTGSNTSLDLTANASKISNIEVISLANVAHGSVNLTGADIGQISGNGSLYIVSDGDDAFEAGNGYTHTTGVASNDQIPGHLFYEFHDSSGSLLFVDTNFYSAGFNDGVGGFVAESSDASRVVAHDPDVYPAGTSVTYRLFGDDAALFNIDGAGNIRFKTGPDYEHPSDFNHDNNYSFNILVDTDRAEPTKFWVANVSVYDVNDNAPVFDSATTATTPENVATTTAVYTAHATDADATAANNTVHYSLASGGDNDLFHINANSGAVMFNTSPDFETPLDANHDNQYDITVLASDGLAAHNVNLHVAIMVTDVLLA